jgi:hypothetical protein
MNFDLQKKSLREHRKQVVRAPTTIVPVGKPLDPPASVEKKPTELEERRQAALHPVKILMQWSAPEFVYYEKNRTWYLIVVIVFAALIAYAVYSQSFLMGIAFFVAGAIFYLYAQKKPATLDIKITENGIQYHDRLFPYEDLKGFWITYDPPEHKYLNVATKYLLVPKLSILLTDQDPVALRKILIEELPEDKRLEDGAADHLGRRIRF